MKRMTLGGLIFTSALLVPVIASGQSATTGAIAGIVRDTTGAVLPGVTVEAASPALIEKVRVAVTDGQGNYKIIDLRPGTYSVTFTLPGFSTFKREGIELTAGFTANASAELKVGSLQETVTVSGASPVIDIQNSRTQTVLSSELLSSVPVSKTILGLANITLGVSNVGNAGSIVDVGGSKGDGSSFFTIHGIRSNEQRMLLDGLNQNIVSGGGGGRRLFWTNDAGVQETVVVTAGASPEIETGGMTINFVPKEGGNTFKGYFNGAFANDKLQSENLSDELKNRGLTSLPGVKRIYDIAGAFGGPIVRDRLWFFTGDRKWASAEYQPGAFYNMATDRYHYIPDRSRPGFTNLPAWDLGGRVTSQVTAKNKFTFSYNYQTNCQCNIFLSSNISPEATPKVHQEKQHRPQGTWTYAVSNRFLIEAGAAFSTVDIRVDPVEQAVVPGVAGIRIVDTSTGFSWGNDLFGIGGPGGVGLVTDQTVNQRFSASYVLGSHALKFGEVLIDGKYSVHADWGGNVGNPFQVVYNFRGGSFDPVTGALVGSRPVQVVQFAAPFSTESRIRNLGLFAQDQWTIKRLTLNLGVRYDRFTGRVPAGTREGGVYLAAFSYAEVKNKPDFKDVSPRLGAAYDLFGNGKTAIKGFVGRFVGGVGTEFADNSNPARVVLSTTRTWNDLNGDFIPDCVLTNPVANGECAAIDNRAFGRPLPAVNYDASAIGGWGNRPHYWQGTVGIQQELYPGVALNVTYFRAQYAAFTVTQNTLVTPSSFDSYCITAPSDSRLPGGGGNQICGLYDVKPTSFGLVDNVITAADPFGKEIEKYDGVDATITARYGQGGFVNGGFSFGRRVVDVCFANTRPDITPSIYTQGTSLSTASGLPRDSAFCNMTPPWSAGTQFKLNGSYPLPYGIEPSFTFQNVPGLQQLAIWNVPAATVLASSTLGRRPTTAVVPVQLIPTGARYLDRVNQLDLRFAKVMRVAGARVRGNFDIYNVFNGSTILQVNQTFGPAWLRPTLVQGGRLFKFSGQLDF